MLCWHALIAEAAAVAAPVESGEPRVSVDLSRGGILIEFRPVKGNALVSALSITSLEEH